MFVGYGISGSISGVCYVHSVALFWVPNPSDQSSAETLLVYLVLILKKTGTTSTKSEALKISVQEMWGMQGSLLVFRGRGLLYWDVGFLDNEGQYQKSAVG